MSIPVKGNTYSTITDAAQQFGVSSKTVSDWIKKRIIDEPPQIEYGVRTIRHFPPEYIKRAESQLNHYREHKKLNRSRGK